MSQFGFTADEEQGQEPAQYAEPTLGDMYRLPHDGSVRGVYTSEFLTTVLVVVAALVLAVTGKVGGDIALGAITGAVGLYGVARGLAKKG